MSTNYTEKLGLTLWEADDPVLRTEFNANNQKLDRCIRTLPRIAVGSYVGTFTSTGNFMPLIVLAVSAGAMACFTYFIEKKNQQWLENFSIAGSMLLGMAAAVVAGLVL